MGFIPRKLIVFGILTSGKNFWFWASQWLSGEEPLCYGRRPVFHPWVGKIPWRRAWKPALVSLPGESPRTEEPGEAKVHGVAESDTAEQLSHSSCLTTLGSFVPHSKVTLLRTGINLF